LGGGHTAAVRIIAGRFRGQGIAAPKGDATRPTSDRVREALFSILGDVEGLDVLDLYAGSGALGLEALSRGARSATFVDEARTALAALRANIASLAVVEETAVVAAEARAGLKRLARAGRTFGLALVDPPYAHREVVTVLKDLVALRLLVPGAWVVLEHAARSEPPVVDTAPGLVARFSRAYGDTALTFYRWSNVEAA
jgi:16S rRNA (guanine(966)-N(2))-methyltransferase RsmD